ncbi:MAG: Metallo-beta-lactamase superfamily [Gaiellales bacterium]|nr:Metallo-beta-lactamase superfamily [Gaiellales bacterium]
MNVAQLRPGLWCWTVADRVGVFLESDGAIVLIDPVLPEPDSSDGERFWRALDRDVERVGRPPLVLLTNADRQRALLDAAAVCGRYLGARARGPAISGDGFAPGAELPGGVRACATADSGRAVLWIAAHGALATGDELVTGRGGLRLTPDRSYRISIEQRRAALMPLLELPVELVLVSRGEPVLEGASSALRVALGG